MCSALNYSSVEKYQQKVEKFRKFFDFIFFGHFSTKNGVAYDHNCIQWKVEKCHAQELKSLALIRLLRCFQQVLQIFPVSSGIGCRGCHYPWGGAAIGVADRIPNRLANGSCGEKAPTKNIIGTIEHTFNI